MIKYIYIYIIDICWPRHETILFGAYDPHLGPRLQTILFLRLTPARALNYSQEALGRESPQAGVIISSALRTHAVSIAMIQRDPWETHRHRQGLRCFCSIRVYCHVL